MNATPDMADEIKAKAIIKAKEIAGKF